MNMGLGFWNTSPRMLVNGGLHIIRLPLAGQGGVFAWGLWDDILLQPEGRKQQMPLTRLALPWNTARS